MSSFPSALRQHLSQRLRLHQTQNQPGAQSPFATVAPLLGASLLLGAGAGFVLAAVLTLSMALYLPIGLWWEALVQAHGHLQLYGWAGLFVLGVAFHFLPRLRGAPLAFPRLIRWIVGAQVVSLLLRAVSEPLTTLTGAAGWRSILVISGALECLAFSGVLVMLIATLAQKPALRARPALWSVLPFLVCAFAALCLASVVNLANVIQAAQTSSGLVLPTGDTINVTLGLFGFLIPMALAMSARALPMYAGLEPFPRRILWSAAFTYAAGLALTIIGAALTTTASLWLSGWATNTTGLGLALMGAVLLVFVGIFLRTMRRRGQLPARVGALAPSPAAAAQGYVTHVKQERGAYGPFVALIASAYLWATLGGILLLMNGLMMFVGLTPPVAQDASRHALALGFIALLLCGVAPRMLPGFSGGHIASPKLVRATLWLGNVAAILRIGSILVAPLLAHLSYGAALDSLAFGLSGPVGLALALCLLINLWPAIWPRDTRLGAGGKQAGARRANTSRPGDAAAPGRAR